MNKKILSITLITLFILPVLCFAGEVEVGEIRLEWKRSFGTISYLTALIPIENLTNSPCRIGGEFLFYDRNGSRLNRILFYEDLKARENKTIYVREPLTSTCYRETVTFKLSMEIRFFGLTMWGRPTVRGERILTLPPWDWRRN